MEEKPSPGPASGASARTRSTVITWRVLGNLLGALRRRRVVTGAGRAHFFPHRVRIERQIGKNIERAHLVVSSDVRVPVERQCSRGVASERHANLDADVGPVERRDERMPQAVEVGEPALLVLVGDLSGLQVLLEHLDHLVGLGHGERGRIGHPQAKVGVQDARRVGPKVLHVLAPVLAVGSLNGHGRRSCFELKARSRKAPQLAGTESALQGKPVEQRTLTGRHAEAFGGLGRRADERLLLLHGQCPADMPAVHLGVQQAKTPERILVGPPRPHHPAGEHLDSPEVVIDRDRAPLADIAQIVEEPFHLGRVQVRPRRAAGSREDAPRPADGIGQVLRAASA